jgi:2-C-methyl-D-erythritol 2,4-cyclodiphosphate synthase
MRIGHGFDAHRLAPDRALVLGGVTVPSEMGLLGHSDADVLTHAVMDALLGAAGLEDIGTVFPSDDPAYRDASSLSLLRQVRAMLEERDYDVINVDCTVIAQVPRLSPYREEMETLLADALDLLPPFVNVKFTTEEGLGYTGAREGIAAHAVALIE